MSQATAGTDLAKVGVWAYPRAVTAESVNELEQLGYSALWLANPGTELDIVDRLLAATRRLVVGTYILNVWSTPAKEAAEVFHRIDDAFPGRFVLGIGSGHREVNRDYQQPLQAVLDYLDQLDDLGVPEMRRALAALGPRMLEVARDRTAAALPYMVTADYIRGARVLLGPHTVLVSEQKVVITDNPRHARALGRDGLGTYLGLTNVQHSLRRSGFRDDDVAARVRDHLNAGADQVLVNTLTTEGDMMPTLRALARRL